LAGKSLSVIIPNYNGRQLLEAYLPFTFTALNNTGVSYEVIIIDDCSKDESISFVRENYPQVKLLINEVNGGFSYSCNKGIQAANNELIFLLNSDVKLTPDYFVPLWKYFDSPDTFGVTGRIIDMEGDRIQDAARVPGFNGYKIKTGYFYYTDDTSDRSFTFYLSGANALIDTAKLKQMGGFDEIFSPFYGEDLDLGIRAWRAGWVCYYEHQAVCRHQGSASTNNYKTPKWVKSIYYRNRFYVHAIHLTGLAKALWLMQITLIDLLPKLLIGQWWMWKSYTGFLKNSAAIANSRAKLKKLMQANNSDLSLQSVFATIRKSVKGKNLTRLKA
jgi:GT2 family glycosyltransferase